MRNILNATPKTNTKDITREILNTRQEADRSQRQPKCSFFFSFYRNLRHLPQFAAGVGATPIPLH